MLVGNDRGVSSAAKLHQADDPALPALRPFADIAAEMGRIEGVRFYYICVSGDALIAARKAAEGDTTMTTTETTKVDEVKDAILDGIANRLATAADSVDAYVEIEKLAVTYRNLADARS